MEAYVGTGLFRISDADGARTGFVDTRDGSAPFSVHGGGVGERLSRDGAGILPRRQAVGSGNDSQTILGAAREIHCALVLDLGNSRTSGIVIDDFDCQEQNYSFHIVPLALEGYSREHSLADVDEAVFGSVITTEQIDLKETGWAPLSCARVGKTAHRLSKQTRNIPSAQRLAFAFVSPKLDFWDDHPIQGVGFVHRAMNGSEAPDILSGGEVPEELRNRVLRKSDLIGEMVVELVEQAEAQVNRWASKTTERNCRDGWRRITHVALTYPTSWTVEERNRYRECIQNKIDRDWVLPLGLPPVRVDLSIDEASAVLLAYAMNETGNMPDALPGEDTRQAVRWMKREIGERIEYVAGLDQFANHAAKVAVIDVGGGTSDLSVCQLSIPANRRNDAGMVHGEDWTLSMETENGIGVAGNEFLRAVLERMILPALFVALDEQDLRAKRGTKLRQQLSQAGEEGRRYRKDLCLFHFYPMALACATKARSKKKVPPEGSFEALCSQFVAEYGGAEHSIDPMNVVEAVSSRLDDEGLLRIAHETFDKTVIDPFSDAIRATQPDWVLLAGKPFEIPAIRTVFETAFKKILKPKTAGGGTTLRFLDQYKLSDFWRNRLLNGEFDVKMLTVIGGAMAFMKKTDHAASTPVFERLNLPRRTTRGFVWKMVNLADQEDGVRMYISESEVPSCLGSRQLQMDVTIRGPVGFVRRREGLQSMPAQLGYVLRPKAGVRGPVNVSIMYTEASGSLELLDGSRAQAELMMSVGSNERNWVESGDISLDFNA